jgi:hypothetical protein
MSDVKRPALTKQLSAADQIDWLTTIFIAFFFFERQFCCHIDLLWFALMLRAPIYDCRHPASENGWLEGIRFLKAA